MQFLSFESGLNKPLPEALSAPDGWPNMQKVDMHGCSTTASDYSALLQSMATLEHLTYLDLSAMDVSCTHGSDHGPEMPGLQIAALQHLGLSVDCAQQYICAPLAQQLPRCTSLTSLVLTGPATGKVPLACVENACQLLHAASCLPNLAVLTCGAVPIGSAVSEGAVSSSPEDIEPAACSDTLPIQSLTVYNPDTYSPEVRAVYEMAVHGVPSLPWQRLAGLTHLQLEAPSNFEFTGAVAEFMQSLGCLNGLKSFHMSNFRVVQRSAEALSGALAAMTLLTALSLCGSCVVQVKSMYATANPLEHPNTAISKLVSLERLALTGQQCHELPFGKVAWSLMLLTRLTHLEIAYGTAAKGFLPMSERIAIAIGRLPDLQELRLDLFNTHGVLCLAHQGCPTN
jgi:hypothetical protein